MSRSQSRSVRYDALRKKTDVHIQYALQDALRVIKENATAKFDESIDMAIHLNLKKSESVRGIVKLPHNFGKKRRIIVFAKGEQVRQAENAGAELVGGSDLVAKIKGGWLEFDIAVATPEMMKEVASLGVILGRRGLMPNPKTGTVTMDVATAIRELVGGRREFRADKGGTVHAVVGKASMDNEQLTENSVALFDTVRTQKPDNHKGAYINNVYLSSTMGVGLSIEMSSMATEGGTTE